MQAISGIYQIKVMFCCHLYTRFIAAKHHPYTWFISFFVNEYCLFEKR